MQSSYKNKDFIVVHGKINMYVSHVLEENKLKVQKISRLSRSYQILAPLISNSLGLVRFIT